jgi:endogenous inhibitor of DNA gyrase (YacG/DUF329 family)
MTAAGKCPICGRPAEPSFKPFCSRRCADLDLQRWLTGAYAIPASDDDEDGEGALPPPGREGD